MKLIKLTLINKFDWKIILKLNIGGTERKDGWKILSIENHDYVDIIGNISDLSQFSNESIEEIYASHVLEHVPHSEMLETLKGIYRVLRRGGKFFISVPDMDVLCHTFISPFISAEIKFHIMKIIFGGQINKYDFHHFGWNHQFINDFLKESGFKNITRVSSLGIFNDTSEYKPYGFSISLNVVAIK